MRRRVVFILFVMFILYHDSRGENVSNENFRFDSLRVKAQRMVNTSDEIVYLDSMLSLAQAMDSVRLQCQTMGYMVRNYYNRMKPDSLLYWFERLDKLSLEHKFYSVFFDAYSLVCFWELYDKNYDSALDKANRLYLLAKDLDNSDGMIASYETIGLIYMETFRYVEAIKSFKEGLALQRSQRNVRYAYQFQFISYIIESYMKLKDYKGVENALGEAYELIDQCIDNEKNFPVDRCLWLLNCYNIEMYVSQKMPEKAEKYIIEAQKYEEVDDFYVYCYYHLVSATYYSLLGLYEKALNSVEMVLSQTGDDYLPALKIKAELLLNAGKGKESAVLYNKSINLIDSTYNESLSKQINQLRTIHEVDKLELKNKGIELETERYKLTITLVLIVVLFLVLTITVIHYFRLKRIKNLLVISDKNLKKEKELLICSEKSLMNTKERLELSNKVKDFFIANLSHEIRTPLNSIVGFSSLLADKSNSKENKEFASIVKDNSDLLLKLVDDTVYVSLLQAGQVAVAEEDVDLIKFCNDLLREFNSRITSQIALNFTIPNQQFLLRTDKVLLKRILDNLLFNAMKFTKQGEINFICQIDVDKNKVLFVVEDTGCGIPEDKQDKIFESFEKIDEFTQGIGLGLTICKMTSEIIGGSISLDANYDKGTRMIFIHPIIKK